jgi:hypothetical protein
MRRIARRLASIPRRLALSILKVERSRLAWAE